METKFCYHYCATLQPSPGMLSISSGMIERSTPVRSKEDYSAVRELIAKENNWDVAKMHLNALSLL